MKKDVVKKFTRFLKERGAYTEFITEFKRQVNIETRIGWAETEVGIKSDKFKKVPNNTFKSYYKSLNQAKELINYAFGWSDTRLKYDYWASLSFEWRKMVKEFNKI